MGNVSRWKLAVLGIGVILLTFSIVSFLNWQNTNADLEVLRTDYEGISSQNQTIQMELTSLKNNFNNLSEEYETMCDKFPPRHFSSVSELENWLVSNNISEQALPTTYAEWYAMLLQAQQDAFNDGYILSVQYHFCDERQVIEYIMCLAYINGRLWFCDPLFDEVYPDDNSYYQFGLISLN